MYKPVYVDCAAIRADPKRLGKKAIALVKDYVTHLNETCFPYAPRTLTTGLAFDAAFGVTAAERLKSDRANEAAGVVYAHEQVFFITTAKGEFVAGCTTRWRYGAAKARANEIDSVCVSPVHRGKGACKLMIASVAKFYLDAGDDVVIVCEPGNEGACRCYGRVFERSRLSAKAGLRKFWGIRPDALPARAPTLLA